MNSNQTHRRSIVSLLSLCTLLVLSLGAQAEPAENLKFLKMGTRYFFVGAQGTGLPYVARIVEPAGGGWFLVESEITRIGASEPQKVRQWINFAHVASVREVTAEDEKALVMPTPTAFPRLPQPAAPFPPR